MSTLQTFSKDSRPFLITCLFMLIAFALSVAGLALDPRVITGAPAWLKPLKFALSTFIFAASLAWLYQYLTVAPRVRHGLAWVLSSALVLEVAIIDVQAARGIPSHFNVGSPVNGALFAIMGVAIAILWICMLWLAVLLFLQRFSDVPLGWALRLGMAVTVVGAAAGGMMLSPTREQMPELTRHGQPAAIGGHTVGARDGGAGLPGVGWSAQHGDLRIPHFFGLHALQLVPLCAWLLIRRRRASIARQVTLVFSVAASYLAFIVILTWQALRGQSIVEPDATTLTAFATWFVVTALLVAGLYRQAPLRLTNSTASIA